MSTVAEFKAAIDKSSAHERTELEALVWPDWDRPLVTGADTPPGVPEKLAEAMAGRFVPGNPANIDRLLANLG